jgi:hypothetical protein
VAVEAGTHPSCLYCTETKTESGVSPLKQKGQMARYGFSSPLLLDCFIFFSATTDYKKDGLTKTMQADICMMMHDVTMT